MTQWRNALFLIALSLEVVVLAYIFMYSMWMLTVSVSDNIVDAIITILGGIIGFAIGSFIFWRFSVRFSGRGKGPK